MLNTKLITICIFLVLTACKNKPQLDSLFYNGKIQTVNQNLAVVEAMAISEGKIVATGTKKDLEKDFKFKNSEDLNNQFVYPGLIDAHCHFYGQGIFMQMVDLTNCKSFTEVVDACIKFYSRHPQAIIYGRGWDQNKWEDKSFPVNTELNQAFPDIPIVLKRIDGHAAIVNDLILKRVNFTEQTKIYGGDLIKIGNKLTGVLIDNAVDSLMSLLPKYSNSEIVNALLLAQKACFDYGLTSVQDAGLEPEIIEIIDSLHKTNSLKIRINAMVSISNKNINWLVERKGINTDYLHVNSFKMYADGALGSRGACLLKPYNDEPKNTGFLLSTPDELEQFIKLIAHTNFQLNTHCIGDSANSLILNLYGKYLGENNDRRWRIEHAQVINQNDFHLFNKYQIVPSVQPTHATSDMAWAEKRIGSERVKSAYAYKLLLNQNNWIPLGTDFPVEAVSPFYTFDAAVTRKDANGYPISGFEPKNALTRTEALKGISIWAAKAAFEEDIKGSLETGKFADFIVLNEDLLHGDMLKIRNIKPVKVYVNGMQVK